MVSESEHEVVVERLEEIMQNDAQFTPSVLDALSNLNLREELLTRVHDSVMPRLGPSAPRSCLAQLPLVSSTCSSVPRMRGAPKGWHRFVVCCTGTNPFIIKGY